MKNTMASSIENPIRNDIISNLPEDELDMLMSNIKLVSCRAGECLYRTGDTLQYGYFPIDAVVSLSHATESGSMAGSAYVGHEGMAGVSLLMGSDYAFDSAVIQSAGAVYRVPAHHLRKLFRLGGGLQTSLLRYMQALLSQTSQTAVCNRHHSLEQQLCRWLLQMADRLSSNEVFTTHESLANSLGVRREGITIAARQLHGDGYIRCNRGHITVVNRKGLEQRACECYKVIRKELVHLQANTCLESAPRKFPIPGTRVPVGTTPALAMA